MQEVRFTNGEVEVRSEGAQAKIAGYAAIFNSNSRNLGGFTETITPGAFTKTIQEADVRAYLNHDKNLILARTKSGTLKLAEDSTGLHYELEAPNTSYARDLLVSIERGDINQSSFAFSVVGPNGESWGYTDSGFPQRSLHEVRLFDVSPVTLPAYEDTTTGLGERSLVALCELRGVDPAQVAALPVHEAVRALLDGTEIPPAAAEQDESASAQPERSPSLNVHRARLELLAKRK